MCHSRKSLNGFWLLNLHCSIYVTFLKIHGVGGQIRSCQGQVSRKYCPCVLCMFCSLCLVRKHLGASCLLVVRRWPFKIPWWSPLASASLSFHSAMSLCLCGSCERHVFPSCFLICLSCCLSLGCADPWHVDMDIDVAGVEPAVLMFPVYHLCSLCLVCSLFG